MPDLDVFSWLWRHFMCLDYVSVTVELSLEWKGKGERGRKKGGPSGEQRTKTLAHFCVKFSVQILSLAIGIELNLIFSQFCEGRLDSCFNFPGEKRFALCRCLSLTMAISFKGVESPALGLLEIWLGLIFFGTAFRREMSYFINANSFPALYARCAHSQTQLPAFRSNGTYNEKEVGRECLAAFDFILCLHESEDRDACNIWSLASPFKKTNPNSGNSQFPSFFPCKWKHALKEVFGN